MKCDEFLKYKKNFDLEKFYLPTYYKGYNNIIDLNLLYKGIEGYISDLDDIVSIILFGSSIHYPGYIIEKYQQRKYILFGLNEEKTQKKFINVNDVDFLIITKKQHFDGKYISEKINEYIDGSSFTSELVSSKIDLINRSIDQVINGLHNNDTISINALKNGVILCDDFFKNNFYIKNESNWKLHIKDNNLKLNFFLEEK